MIRALIVAEDSRFYTHNGIGTDTLKKTIKYNFSEKRVAYRTSTIPQQTAKNILLSPSRNP